MDANAFASQELLLCCIILVISVFSSYIIQRTGYLGGVPVSGEVLPPSSLWFLYHNFDNQCTSWTKWPYCFYVLDIHHVPRKECMPVDILTELRQASISSCT